jgi:hypothetical protein
MIAEHMSTYARKVSAFKRTAPMNPCPLIVGRFLQCFGRQPSIGMEFWYFTVVSAAEVYVA